MKRRDFLKGVFGAVAVIATAKIVGAGPVAVPVQDVKLTDVLPDGVSWRVDPNCPPDQLYFVDYKQFFGDPPNPNAVVRLNLQYT
jgi:hypothetical protein